MVSPQWPGAPSQPDPRLRVSGQSDGQTEGAPGGQADLGSQVDRFHKLAFESSCPRGRQEGGGEAECRTWPGLGLGEGVAECVPGWG